MRILFALLSALVGLALVFGGYRLARMLIPLMGFIAGLSLGGAIVADNDGSAFLGTVLGVVIGIMAGLILAVLAYFYYALAVVVLAASLGYWAGSGFVLLLGFSPGVLSAVAGIALGIMAGIIAVMANAPKYVLIVFTAVAGAVMTIGGVLLLFNQIPLDVYSYTTANVAISNSFIWTVAALALLGVGTVVQAQTSTGYEFDEWAIGDHSHDLPTTHSTHPTGAH